MLRQLYQYALRPSLCLFILILLPSCGKDNAQATVVPKQSEIQESLCDFHKGMCEQTEGEIKFSIGMTPAFAPSEKPLELMLSVSKAVEIQSAVLQGRDMFMGIIPINLIQTDKTHYLANFVYGSCSSDYMIWRLSITYLASDKIEKVHFDFLADNADI